MPKFCKREHINESQCETTCVGKNRPYDACFLNTPRGVRTHPNAPRNGKPHQRTWHHSPPQSCGRIGEPDTTTPQWNTPRLDRTGEPGTIATGTVDQKSRRQIGTRGGRRRVLWTSPKTSPNTMLQRTQAGKQSKRNCLAREEAHSPPPGSTSGDRVGQQPFACEVRQLDPMSGTYRR